MLFNGELVRAVEGKPDTSAIVCLSIVAGIIAVVTVFKWRAAYKKRQTKKDLATNVETIRTANPTVYDMLKTAFTENPNLRLMLPSTSKARREEQQNRRYVQNFPRKGPPTVPLHTEGHQLGSPLALRSKMSNLPFLPSLE